MKLKKHLSILLLPLCLATTFVVGAQSGFTAKGASSNKTISGGNVTVKSSTATKSKSAAGLTISNGNKQVTIDSSTVTGTVTASSLNVRSGPSTSYGVIGSLSKGATVTVLESTSGWYKIKYNSGTGYVSADYVTVNGTPPSSGGGSSTTPTGALKKIIIDPGHGGSDPGAIGPNGVKEKDVVLKVSLKMRDLLKNKGLTVAMTRTTDTYLSLDERTKYANSTGGDFFVSMHANSFSSQSANGTETFTYQSTGRSAEIAKVIQTKLVNAIKLTNRGNKTANYYVIRNTNMPSALVELAFISNPNEESLLKSDAFQTKCANAIVDGIVSFK